MALDRSFYTKMNLRGVASQSDKSKGPGRERKGRSVRFGSLSMNCEVLEMNLAGLMFAASGYKENLPSKKSFIIDSLWFH